MASIILDDVKLLYDTVRLIFATADHVRNSAQHNSKADQLADTLHNYAESTDTIKANYIKLHIIYQSYGSPTESPYQRKQNERHYGDFIRHIVQLKGRTQLCRNTISNAFWRWTTAMQEGEISRMETGLMSSANFLRDDNKWIVDRQNDLYNTYHSTVPPVVVAQRRAMLEATIPPDGSVTYALGDRPTRPQYELPPALPPKAKKEAEAKLELEKKFRAERLKNERKGRKYAEMQENKQKLIGLLQSGHLPEKWIYTRGAHALMAKKYEVRLPLHYPDRFEPPIKWWIAKIKWNDDIVLEVLDDLNIFELETVAGSDLKTATYRERCQDCEARGCRLPGHKVLDAFTEKR